MCILLEHLRVPARTKSSGRENVGSLLGRVARDAAGTAYVLLLTPLMLMTTLGLVFSQPARASEAPVGYVGSGLLTGVACPSASQCTALDSPTQPGGATREVTFNPRSPYVQAPVRIDDSASPGVANPLSCPAVTQCTAVDQAGSETTFNPESPATPAQVPISGASGTNLYFVAVSCPSTSQCTAVGNVGGFFAREVTFNPSSPGNATAVGLTGPPVSSVSCPSISQCTATTIVGGLELTFDPTSPGTPSSNGIDQGYSIADLVCPSVSECVALDSVSGASGEVTFNPQSPGNATRVVIDAQAASSLSCPAVTQCTAVDANRALSFNPMSVAVTGVTLEHSVGSVDAVACASTLQCAGVDRAGGEVTFIPGAPGSAQQSWIAAEADGMLSGVWCGSVTACAATEEGPAFGEYGVVTFNPRSPTLPVPVMLPAAVLGFGADIRCLSVAECLVFYDSGTEATFAPVFQGRVATGRIPLTETGGFYLSCPTALQCTVVKDGAASTFDPWRPNNQHAVRFAGRESKTVELVCADVRQCTAVDARGNAVTFSPRGRTRARVVSIAPFQVRSQVKYLELFGMSIACASATQCTVVTTYRQLLCNSFAIVVCPGRDGPQYASTFDPQTAAQPRRIVLPPSPEIGIVSCPTRAECVATGQASVLAFNPLSGARRQWVRPFGGRYNALYGLSCPSATQCTALADADEVTFNPRR
jgi:hypothetical protein